MRLESGHMIVEFFPTSSTKRFVQVVTFGATEEFGEGIMSHRTINRGEMIYEINTRINSGYQVTDFHTEEYTGNYTPLMCWFHISFIKLPSFPTMTNFTGVFLTVENHGCVYTICTEGELFYAPILANGSVNFNEFDVFYFEEEMTNEEHEEMESIQGALIDMMQRAGLYFQQPVAVWEVAQQGFQHPSNAL